MRKTVLLLVAVTVFFVLFTNVGMAVGSYVWPIEGNVLVAYKADGHRGIDIAGTVGDSVVSARDGKVVWIGKTPRGEPCITIEHSDGVSSTYLPVKSSVNKGQEVDSSDVIGTISAEGDPSNVETHLHFGLYDTATRNNKVYLNPTDYLSAPSFQLASDSKVDAAEPITEYAAELKPDVIPSLDVSAQTPNVEPFMSESINVLNGRACSANPASSNISKGDLNAFADKRADQIHTSVGVAGANVVKASIIESGIGYMIVPGKDTHKNGMAESSTRQLYLKSSVSGQSNAGIVSNRNNLIIDNTYHSVENKSTLNSVIAIGRQAKVNKSVLEIGQAFNNQIEYQGSNSQKTSKTLIDGSLTYASNMSAMSGWKQDIIESINPFVLKKAGKVQPSKMNFVSDKAQKIGDLKNDTKASYQRKQWLARWVSKAVSWEGLPDVVAILAITGIVILSVIMFFRNSRNIWGIIPTSSTVSC